MTPATAASTLALPELLASVSLAIDLGVGVPMEHVARATLIGQHFARTLDLDADDGGATYFTSLLAWMGCTSDSYEVAQLFGDDHRWRSDTYGVDFVGLGALRYMLRHAGATEAPFEKLRARAAVLVRGEKTLVRNLLAHCQVTANLADELGLGGEVKVALAHNFTRWDGKGFPEGVKGDAIPMATRIAQMCDEFEMLERARGAEEAAAEIAALGGGAYDPDLAVAFADVAGDIVEELGDDSHVDALVAEAPESAPTLRGDEIDRAMQAVGDFVDLKSPYFAGHSRGVAELAYDAAIEAGAPPDEARTARRAGYLHDLGRAGVPNTVWDKGGPLNRSEFERVRLHSYYTERVLARPAFEPLRILAASHHERLDGSGYHKGVSGGQLLPLGRILAAADAYHAMLEPRPHRPALGADAAAGEVRGEVEAGRLDPDAAECVLAAAGHVAKRKRRSGPAGLTARELDVLVELARGASNKRIAETLHISKKTVSNHVEHIYAKIGASTRPAATLFAVQHGLVHPLTDADTGPS